MDSLITWKVIFPLDMSLPNNLLLLSIKFYIENQKKRKVKFH